jgi:catechol 2,3-dioxygenase-like lactoylglutathione lyase family enzyme
MVSDRVPDLDRARQWYQALLKREPSFDSPMAVVFAVGGCSLALEERPSESALTVAFCRALATREERTELRVPDSLAEIFLSDEGKRPPHVRRASTTAG